MIIVEKRFRIGELSERAQVTRRTVHYYLSRGLLPNSEGKGVGTYYSDEHLYRILLIKKLQESYLPLDEIKNIITRLSLEEVKEQLDNKAEQKGFIILEAPSNYDIGKVYKKLDLEFEVEIHYPIDNPKAEELVKRLYKTSEKYNREG